MDWENIGIDSDLARAVRENFGFKSPTPVQKAGIPHFIGNKDICVESCTGSGKTLTFLLPIFHKLIKSGFPKCVFALIISPSRELANQTYEVAEKLSKNFPLASLQCLIGGHSREDDIFQMATFDKNIVIGTPGRIADLLEAGDVNFKEVEILILDEADRLLDMGFKEKITWIIESLPRQRRTGLFSATMTTDVQSLIKAGLRNPIYINVKVTKNDTNHSQALPKGLTNYYSIFPTYLEKLPALARFLYKNPDKKVIVFFATCASTNFYLYVLERLEKLGNLKFFRLHGKMKQSQREKIYKEFSEAPCAVLLTTDLIARGIDFPDINWIVQFDPPQNPDFFVHRIGRTARANREGDSMLFLTKHEETYINYLTMKNIEFSNIKLKRFKILDKLKDIVLEDREGYEKAQAAFVAYVRYYKEHNLNYIFQFKHLELGFLAQGFCLLRLPRVSEILGKNIENFEQSEINPDDIAYKDPQKEERRQKLLIEKEEMIARKKEIKIKALRDKKGQNKRKRSRSEKRDAKKQSMVEDFDELGREESIISKIRKGKMNSEEVKSYIAENPHIKTLFRKKKH
ncbi:hypothetical protein SteCoe_5849 [Stentor coeruleus]|uniref:ATP-dependent RNA helicase n=1 Tax=Stentor coeruleus TaxID=5963 RepID=A0A1R2CRH0_9CILI|nr:hypothetical protein SteCoe_5849 [Stentor coeruleus]